MFDFLEREQLLLGQENIHLLSQSRVAVIGLGGVGGTAVEGLARCGVGHLLVMDYDCFQLSNLNRQILATRQTIGRAKAEVAKERILSINPEAEVVCVPQQLTQETLAVLEDFQPDFVIDAVDQVTAKLLLIEWTKEKGIPSICCLGTGNRLTAQFTIGELSDTAGCGCPLARIMRRECRTRGFENVQVLYSTLAPEETGVRTPQSISFVPPVAGYLLAGHAVRTLLGVK